MDQTSTAAPAPELDLDQLEQIDREAAAMKQVIGALIGLDTAARKRVLASALDVSAALDQPLRAQLAAFKLALRAERRQ
jgi:hypothetical protein